MTYTATLNGTTYQCTSKAKKAPAYFVIVECHSTSEHEDFFPAWRSTLKSAESAAKRWEGRFNAGTVTAHVVSCSPA